MRRKLPLIVGCVMLSGCTKAEAAASTDVNVYVDRSRHVVCYSLVSGQLATNPAYAISCLPLDSTNSIAK
jgi:hypothetical protein